MQTAGNPVRLCPHIKTHKCPDIVKMHLDAGIRRFKCATIDEAKMLAACGAEDIVLAYPLYGPAAGRFIRLSAEYPDIAFSAAADSRAGIDALTAAIAGITGGGSGRRPRLLLDVDCGMGRTGAAFDEVPALWAYAEKQVNLEVYGLHVYDGHVREADFEKRCRICDGIYGRIKKTVEDLKLSGASVRRIIAGGTISFPCYARHAELDLSPGTYVLHDAGYRSRYPDLPFEPAAVLFTRVISIPAEMRITVDAGSKAVSTDPEGPPGEVLGLSGVRPVKMSEEHWTLESDSAGRLRPGDPVYILPVHICPTVNLYDEVYTVNEDGSSGPLWKIAARGHSLG